MRNALVLAIVVILVAAGLGTGYEVGNATTHTVTTTSTAVSSTTLTQVSTVTTTVTTSGATWKVISQNATYMGPGCPPPAIVLMALRIPCIDYTNSTTWNASLLQYNGKDFYAVNESVGAQGSSNSITYTVWFDNSTAYCVSPFLSVSKLPTCPPP